MITVTATKIKSERKTLENEIMRDRNRSREYKSQDKKILTKTIAPPPYKILKTSDLSPKKSIPL